MCPELGLEARQASLLKGDAGKRWAGEWEAIALGHYPLFMRPREHMT